MASYRRAKDTYVTFNHHLRQQKNSTRMQVHSLFIPLLLLSINSCVMSSDTLKVILRYIASFTSWTIILSQFNQCGGSRKRLIQG